LKILNQLLDDDNHPLNLNLSLQIKGGYNLKKIKSNDWRWAITHFRLTDLSAWEHPNAPEGKSPHGDHLQELGYSL